MTSSHYYPHGLAVALHQRWPAKAAPLVTAAVLTQFIAVLYQASLFFETSRPVKAYGILAAQAQLKASPVALTNFHFVRFAELRAWNTCVCCAAHLGNANAPLP